MSYQDENTEKPNELNEPLEGYQQPLTFEKIWLMFQETDKQFKETDVRFKETDMRFKETDKKIKELSNLFTSQWGKLIESLVEGSIVKLFREENIDVHYTQERVKGSWKGENFEFDIMAFNEKDMVVIEVKTTLRPDDVKHFLGKMRKLKTWMPRFKDNNTLAAMAYLKADADADRQAEKAGLYLIKATGDSAHIANSKGFTPKIF